MTVTIICTGLIGGSMALALKEKGFAQKIIGVDNNTEHAQKALALGLVDEVADIKNAVAASDFIVLAIPVDAAEKVLPQILDNITHQAVIDVGSTKGKVVAIANKQPNRKQFVA